MKYQMFTDEQILDPGFRKKIISEIKGTENVNRKQQQKAMLEMLRDQIIKFVIQRLEAQGFQKETLAVMVQRATNVNIFKKVVGKKARSYAKGVSRTVGESKEQTEDLEIIAESMGLTQAMKKADRYRKAAKNTLLYIYPEKVEDPLEPGKMVYKLCAKVYFPHLYDVIPDASDPEKMRCLILSPFADESSASIQPSIGAGDGRQIANYANPIFQPDMRDQTIADSPQDQGAQKREYVFWTNRYHLTCDENGVIIPEKTPEGAKNPINRLPAVDLSEERDGSFWALGGDDLMQANILVNLKLTDMEAILHMQGWGQLVITGQDLGDKNFAVGPQKALMMNTANGATVPTDAKILAHDPQTANHMKSTEMHVALCLTTNNLSVKSVSPNLDASSYASGIAKMVDEAENMDDISEDQGYYAGKEKEAFLIAEGWLEQLRGTNELWSILKETAPVDVAEMNIQFHNQETVISETERLTNMKMRKELGIDSIVDLIKKDNPGMSDKEAMAKALKIMNEQAEIRRAAQEAGITLPGEEEKKPGEPDANGDKKPGEGDEDEEEEFDPR